MLKTEKIKKARKWIRDMQKVLPTATRVYISAKETEDWGDIGRTKRGLEIRLNWDHPWETLERWILPHEYAHARVWGRLQAGNEDHDGHLYLEIGVVDHAAGICAAYEE